MIKRIVVEIEEKKHQKIKEKCVKSGKTMKQVVETLLDKWMKGKK